MLMITELLTPTPGPLWRLVKLAGESNESYGYATLGRLFAVGYITGLRDATYGRPSARYGRRVGEGALR